MQNSKPLATFPRTPNRATRSVRIFLLQMAGSLVVGGLIWLVGIVIDRNLGSNALTLFCAFPGLFILGRAVWEIRNRLGERLEIHPDGVRLSGSWRLQSFYVWEHVDTHRDPVYADGTSEQTPSGVGLLEPIYPYYLRENEWAEPNVIAAAVHEAQMAHHLPVLLAEIEAGEIVWFGQYGLSERGVHRRRVGRTPEAAVFWHTIEQLRAEPPLLTWEKSKLGQVGSRRTKRMQRPFKVLISAEFTPPFSELHIYHQTLLFMQLAEALGHPVTIGDLPEQEQNHSVLWSD